MNAEDHDDDEPPAAVDVTLGLICMWSVSLVDSLKKNCLWFIFEDILCHTLLYPEFLYTFLYSKTHGSDKDEFIIPKANLYRPRK